jgi:hypothetical protein
MSKKTNDSDLPDVVYISRSADGRDGRYLTACWDKADAIDEDGPTEVGEYRLVCRSRAIKVIQKA